ncbi:sentrin-specific protease 2 isoform X2 [Lepisosteus oculatus]|uniref:sentrin-specific protease 2 isoform X2 n=1 Tax=Lepisosteus oculatus TaxID=7918 RepID=UPI00073FAB31|nr:PREDICTED: sentrin-specific protease 2 isoform X2 [Lepisosteus oculatus]
MYEWIVNGITSFFVPRSRQRTRSPPGTETPPSSAAAPRLQSRVSPAKRNYQRSVCCSIQTSDTQTECSGIKRPRRDGAVSIVKKTLTGVTGFFRFQNPFTASHCETLKVNSTSQALPATLSGDNNIQKKSPNKCIKRMELNLDNPGVSKKEKAWKNFQPKIVPMITKHNGAALCTYSAEKSKGRNPWRPLQLLPSPLHLNHTMMSSAAAPSRSHRPSLAVEEALKENDKKHYRVLVEMVSSKYTKNHPLPFSRAKQYMTSDASTKLPPIAASPCTPLWTDGCLTRGGQEGWLESGFHNSFKDYEERKVDNLLEVKEVVGRLQTKYSERMDTSASLRVKANLDNLAPQPVDLDLSDEVATRLNLMDCESAVFIQPEGARAHQTLENMKDAEEFPRLTREMNEDIIKALGHGDPDKVLCSAFKLRITQRDLSTLREHNWLNDEVINFYMNLVMARSDREGPLKVYAFSTFFFPKLYTGGHEAVRRWTKTVDLFQKDIVLVPLHLGVHWSLAVIDFRVKTVKYYDSVGQSNEDICHILLHYLKEEYKSKKNKDLSVSKWTVTSARTSEIPLQHNNSDCGVFACKYADYIAKGRPITFTQRHMPYFRKRMMWEILNKTLL